MERGNGMIFYSEVPKLFGNEDVVEKTGAYIYNIVAKFGKAEGISEQTIFDLLRINNRQMFELYKRRACAKGLTCENGKLKYGVPHREGQVYTAVPTVKRNDPNYKNIIDYITFMVRHRPECLFSFTDSVEKPFYMKMVRSSESNGATTNFIVDLITCGSNFNDYKDYIENDYELNHSGELNKVGKYNDNSYTTRIVIIMRDIEGVTKIKTKAEVAIAVPYVDERKLISFQGYNAQDTD